MVLGFALLIAAGLLIDSALSGRSIAESLQGIAGKGLPNISWTETPSTDLSTVAAMGDGGSSSLAPGSSGALGTIVQTATAIAKRAYPYSWGGGHNPQFAPSGPHHGYDCSGAVSAVLHSAGLLDRSMVAAEFMRWGEPGPGKAVTILASPGHVFMDIQGHGWGTGHVGHRDGAGWLPYNRRAGFVIRHPRGL